jgi:hypothetical protein
MIAVVADPSQESVVREFFELFKTPWEFYRPGHSYDAVISSDPSAARQVSARLFIQYGSTKTQFDEETQSEIGPPHTGRDLLFGGVRLPIYGDVATFATGAGILKEASSGKPVLQVRQVEDKIFVRVGYDLFEEIGRLLIAGQPSENAPVPALDLHIQLLRQVIVCSGIALAEIPPVPHGFPFIVCLTHDLDHACIRRHWFDATISGFLYRATLGSALKVARGRLPLRKLVVNCAAVAKLPLVYMGLAKDFWYGFDRYLELEAGRPSTFFVVPFENYPGRSASATARGLNRRSASATARSLNRRSGQGRAGEAPRARATRYDVSHISEKIPRLIRSGCEVAVHGLDAWYEASKGREEAARVSENASTQASGVRMHWLYSDERSPSVLEQAGFAYDSTVGYNDTVGYRAGTGQIFKPLAVNRLLELPMHVMDTALFYPSYLNLSERAAWARLMPIFDYARNHGGVVTINWHDRSIAPERLWGDFYLQILQELSSRGAWFATATQAVSWFRGRRAVAFESDDRSGLRVTIAAHSDPRMPGYILRVHRPQSLSALDSISRSSKDSYQDMPLSDNVQVITAN